MDLKEIGADIKMTLFVNKIYWMFSALSPHSIPNIRTFPFERKVFSLCFYTEVVV
jgi:hypothetical protein